MSEHSENTPKPEGPGADSGPSAEDVARRIGANAGIERRDGGQIDVLKTVGGVRGLLESLLPGLVFLVIFTLWQQLNPALIASVAVAVVFTVARLVRRGVLTQALTGLVGVAICAIFSRVTGEAKDYYVPGFYTNLAYGGALVVSILVRWPLMGVIFGFIRSENTKWRSSKSRTKAYAWATWIVVGVFAARLAVQVPLYFADNVPALGAARLAMGVPLYAAGLWVAWMVSRPQPGTPATDPAA
ncbi:potassium ABC transporter [Arthrobacter sp. UCD-GKA]|uniref:DUF3159 domain-containing protein n=1 Tax=Arthrobacter sp. UCD-GKA TaxID=1913576 RepID=UPI0008DD0B20|nr:DUF3159 domain-containing protein [Arthrobacter sp. UCD-GKA]OIH85966.1 potassium ABC transporter [Arthrobacter sp. UCD-GKA]